MDDPAPRRGEVWLVAFDPAIGGEIQKTRPAVVLSNDTASATIFISTRTRPTNASPAH